MSSCLYIKKRTDLTSVLSITPSFLRNQFSSSGLVIDYRDWQIPLGRRFRALKIWFVLRTYGVSGLQAHIRHTTGLGAQFYSWVDARSDLFRVLVPPAFALTVLAVVPSSSQAGAAAGTHSDQSNPQLGTKNEMNQEESQSSYLERANEITRLVYEKINADGQIFLTSTVVQGAYAIRVVSANPKADHEHLRKAFEILVKTTEEIRGVTKPRTS
jgi:aromatic-L-amino-acid decarboxylase